MQWTTLPFGMRFNVTFSIISSSSDDDDDDDGDGGGVGVTIEQSFFSGPY